MSYGPIEWTDFDASEFEPCDDRPYGVRVDRSHEMRSAPDHSPRQNPPRTSGLSAAPVDRATPRQTGPARPQG